MIKWVLNEAPPIREDMCLSFATADLATLRLFLLKTKILFYFLMFIYLFVRGGAERKGERESQADYGRGGWWGGAQSHQP